jgi:hypothetical protein
MIDLNARRLFHHLLMTVEVDRTNCELYKKTRSGVKIFQVIQTQNPNDEKNTFRSMYPIIKMPTKSRKSNQVYLEDCQVRQLWFTMAPKHILDEYESRKKVHFNKTMDEATAKIEFKERKEQNKMASAGVNVPLQPTIPQNPPIGIDPSTLNQSNDTIADILSGD